ncbi:hypothetical protein HYFRA_00003311 [Hymenoscyphus fraxineus]|uniref:O-methyltransferase C-terminal domain-containing protein n=1 Tax=Hymenoscyphus fraxineus TaxID=746836 RepID=A0A9N9KSL0_9HELO|nr:hypothetical protein HYFRA_00003311 [Hymenoscyphus fraxineus]
MSPCRVAVLAASIQKETNTLEDYLQSQGLPQPDFSLDSPLKLPLPQSIAISVQTALEAADELHSLLLGPLGFILHQVDATHNIIGLHAVSRFEISKRFPVGQEISFSEVAAKCGVDADDMCRILRHAVTNHIFTEPREGFIAHTAVSKALAEVPMLHEWVTMACEDMWPPTTRLVDAMNKWPGSGEPRQTAYNLASRAEGSFFEELERSSERSERFSKAMSLFKIMPGFEPSLVADSKLWKGVSGTVVDVGGANGALACELAKKYPAVQIIVQDLPSVIENTQQFPVYPHTDKVTFQAHDFFSEQPIRGADVYIFRMIFHDWSEKFCKRILQQLIPALKIGARILINDFCIPERGATSMYQERVARQVNF